jgi:hypothetical protein
MSSRFLHFFLLVATLFFCVLQTLAQTKQTTATVKGKIVGESNAPLELATVAVLGTTKATTTDNQGNFILQVPANQVFVLVIKFLSYKEERRTLQLKENEILVLNFKLKDFTNNLDSVVVTNKDEQRNEASTILINPLAARKTPTPFGDAMDMVKGIGLGVVTNSELSSAYSVRGGSFDENLVYVNNMEVYRPFLVTAGQQEGLSFPNPDLIKEIKFSAGGWQPKFGDKLSSVLNIEYKTPKKFAASASLSLLGATGHIEGASKNKRSSFMIGARHKSARYFLNTLPTQGAYLPRFTDIQGLANIAIGKMQAPHRKTEAKTMLTFLFSYAQNRYQVVPQFRKTEFGTFNQALSLSVDFTGQEMMNYDTWQGSLRLTHHFSQKLTSNLIISGVDTQEREYSDVEAYYRLCDINTQATVTSGQDRCNTVRGLGTLYDYRRNALNANIFTVETRNEYRQHTDHTLEFGAKYNAEFIDDTISEYSFSDSADFVGINSRLVAGNILKTNRFSGYVQQNHRFRNHTLTYGFRLHYWDLNQQTVFSPRIQYALKPNWKKDIVFNFAAGYYQQPPFYRELRDFQGNINRNLKAQSSLHLIAGLTWDFRYWGRPFRLLSEGYYKYLTDVVPYDVDNVRLRYYAKNNAIAFVTGIDARLSGEFIKGTDSWLGISLMTAQEKVDGDSKGFIRRPVDQRLTATLSFEDHLPQNPTIRMNMRMLYGTGLPFSVPNNPAYRAALNGSSYWRVDIGFSKIFYIKGNKDRSIWVGLEVLNILGNSNVISYLWIKDYANNSYAVPNDLSQRFFNLRIIGRLN